MISRPRASIRKSWSRVAWGKLVALWSKTEWEIKLHWDGHASHVIKTKIHELASALKDEPERQYITVTGPGGIALEPSSITCPGTTIHLRPGREWDFDKSAATVKLDLSALSALREMNPVLVCIDMEEHNAVAVEGRYRCYWLGFESRLGGEVSTLVRLPGHGNRWGQLWEKTLNILGEQSYESGVFSAPNANGQRKDNSPAGTLALHSPTEAPGGHFVFFRDPAALLFKRAVRHIITFFGLAISVNILWWSYLQPLFKSFGWLR